MYEYSCNIGAVFSSFSLFGLGVCTILLVCKSIIGRSLLSWCTDSQKFAPEEPKNLPGHKWVGMATCAGRRVWDVGSCLIYVRGRADPLNLPFLLVHQHLIMAAFEPLVYQKVCMRSLPRSDQSSFRDKWNGAVSDSIDGHARILGLLVLRHHKVQLSHRTCAFWFCWFCAIVGSICCIRRAHSGFAGSAPS